MGIIWLDPMGTSGAASAASDLAPRNLTEHRIRYNLAALLLVRCKMFKVELENIRASNARAKLVGP
jgi:hypothetical protein